MIVSNENIKSVTSKWKDLLATSPMSHDFVFCYDARVPTKIFMLIKTYVSKGLGSFLFCFVLISLFMAKKQKTGCK